MKLINRIEFGELKWIGRTLGCVDEGQTELNKKLWQMILIALINEINGIWHRLWNICEIFSRILFYKTYKTNARAVLKVLSKD